MTESSDLGGHTPTATDGDELSMSSDRWDAERQAETHVEDPDTVARLREGLERGEVERMPTEIVLTLSVTHPGVTPAIGDVIVDPILLAEATGEVSGTSHPVVGLEVVMVDESTTAAPHLTVIRLVEAAEGPASF